MKAYSRGKNYFERSFIQSTVRNQSCDKLNIAKPVQEAKKINIGKYKILLDQQLGSGYSSKVYKGIEEGKELKRYAIKVIELKDFTSFCLKLFEREIEIHRNLKHDNIVRCYDVFRTKTHIYMVMEYCPHGDLATYIQQKKKLSQPSIADIMTQILNGYRYLVKEGILHRDLKPANVLRSGKIWKISDFGFSIRSGTFVDNVNVGTPLYMPLESLTRSYYSVKTDIFALGIILFELLHGRTPWECESESQLMQKLEARQKVRLTKKVNNPKLKDFIIKSCELSEGKRLSQHQLQSFDFNFNYGKVNQLASEIFTQTCSYRVSKIASPVEDFISCNNAILLSSLNHCKFVYYMIEHIDCYILSSNEKNTFLLVLLKYLLKMIKNLKDGKFRSKRLVRYDEYKVKQEFLMLQDEIEENSIKYEKTYLDYIKYLDIKTIRAVNLKFKQFTVSSQALNNEFFSKLMSYLVSVIKVCNQGIEGIVNDSREQQYLHEKLEAFQNLIFLFRYISTKSKGESLNFAYETLCDYGESKLKKIDFLNIRKEVKNL